MSGKAGRMAESCAPGSPSGGLWGEEPGVSTRMDYENRKKAWVCACTPHTDHEYSHSLSPLLWPHLLQLTEGSATPLLQIATARMGQGGCSGQWSDGKCPSSGPIRQKFPLKAYVCTAMLPCSWPPWPYPVTYCTRVTCQRESSPVWALGCFMAEVCGHQLLWRKSEQVSTMRNWF